MRASPVPFVLFVANYSSHTKSPDIFVPFEGHIALDDIARV